jgi:low temperature requirement protein LtrA
MTPSDDSLPDEAGGNASQAAIPSTDEQSESNRHGVSWFELFFDLVLVAWLMSANSVFSEAEDTAQALQGVLSVVVAYAIWTLNTTVINRFPGDSITRRSLMVTQMLFLIISILAIDPYHGLPNRLGVVALGVVFLALASMYLEVALSPRYNGVSWVPVVSVSAAAGLCFGLSPFVNDDTTVQFVLVPVLACAVAIFPTVTLYSPKVQRAYPIDPEHMSERWGQLLLITLGEGFIFMVEVFWGRESIPRPVTFVIVFLTLFAIWRLIFDSASVTSTPARAFPFRDLSLAHLLLLLGTVGYINAVIEQGIAGKDENFTFLQVGFSMLMVLASLAWINALRRGSFERISVVELVLDVVLFGYGVWLYFVPFQPVASFVSTVSLVLLVTAALLTKIDSRFPGVQMRL